MSQALPSSEFQLIRSIQARVSPSADVLVGIGDDAAIIAPTQGQRLVVTTDSLVPDRHFKSDWSAEDIGHLAMSVNLSDLAAMAATPRWVTLALTLPRDSQWATQAWVQGFLDGFLGAYPGIQLVGGNLSEGPLNIGVSLMGEVNEGAWVSRSGAQVGDRLIVTGTLGDAAGAVALDQHSSTVPVALYARWTRPTARLEAGHRAADYAHAMIDVSDGLLADLSHLLNASTPSVQGSPLGARIQLDCLPTSSALAQAFPNDAARWPLQLSGGSDYELLISVSEADTPALLQALAEVCVPACVIGEITADGQLSVVDRHGHLFEYAAMGWDHFRKT